jgi:hypothetical protein
VDTSTDTSIMRLRAACCDVTSLQRLLFAGEFRRRLDDNECEAAGAQAAENTLGGLIMATAIALDPVTELEQRLETVNGVQPIITIADDMALVSYRLPGGVRTQVWLRGESGWSMRGTDTVSS